MQPVLEHCANCGRCCNRFAVCVTHKDVQRLADFLKIHPREFLELNEDSNEKTRAFPALLVDGRKCILCLKRRKNEHCLFFKHAKGCAVYEARSAVCRVYPFERGENGEIRFMESAQCAERWEIGEEEKKRAARDIGEYERALGEFREIAEKWNNRGGSFEELLQLLLGKKS
ncbi:MAG: YkgJ family cysteine cluster protein [Candidatus Micrarchaeota archaeon]